MIRPDWSVANRALGVAGILRGRLDIQHHLIGGGGGTKAGQEQSEGGEEKRNFITKGRRDGRRNLQLIDAETQGRLSTGASDANVGRMKFPRSPFDQVGGLVFFARMLDKIRLKAAGQLPPDYEANLGRGTDLRLCTYLHVDYEAMAQQVRAGRTDDEVFAWCEEHGRELNEVDVLIWNGFVSKRGLRDEASAALQQYKESSGLGARTDIDTFFNYFDVDEKRRP